MMLPAELKAWLRPWRRSNNRRPTIPREMAQIAGPKMLDVPPIKTWADITDQKVGTSAISNAPTASATIPAAISARLDRRWLTSAPPGSGSGFRRFRRRRCNSHALLVPPVSGEVDGEEWSDSRLNIGEKKIQPVQTMERSGGRHSGIASFRCVRVPSASRCTSPGYPCCHAHVLSIAAVYSPRRAARLHKARWGRASVPPSHGTPPLATSPTPVAEWRGHTKTPMPRAVAT